MRVVDKNPWTFLFNTIFTTQVNTLKYDNTITNNISTDTSLVTKKRHS